MNITGNSAIPDTNESSAEKARQLKLRAETGGASEAQRRQARKIGQDFEALFVGMMMKSMRETVGKDKLTGGGHGEEVYRSLLDQEYAAAAAKTGKLGLGRQIENEIIKQESRRVRKPITAELTSE